MKFCDEIMLPCNKIMEETNKIFLYVINRECYFDYDIEYIL